MKIDILSLFPEMFVGPFSESIIKRGIEKGHVNIQIHNIRDWAADKHRRVDDEPFGGGPGMVMKVDVLHRALESVRQMSSPVKRGVCTILTTPKGENFTQKKAKEFLRYKRLIIVCGHYEGIDQRFNDYIDQEISIGDYVLTGGELPAMVITDAVTRLVPGVVGNGESIIAESFGQQGILDFPQYTRPRVYDGRQVPAVLLSGHDRKIEQWRSAKSLELTRLRRPELLK